MSLIDKKAYINEDEQASLSIKRHGLGDLYSVKMLLRYSSSYNMKFIGGISLILLASLCTIGTGYFSGKLIDQGILLKDMFSIVLFVGIIILLEVGVLFGLWKGRSLIAYYSSLTIYDIRKILFEHLQKLPIPFYDRQPQGRILTRVTHDVEGVENFFTQNMSRFLDSGITSILAMIAMLLTDWELGCILMGAMVPSFLFIYFTRKIVRQANRKLSRSNSTLNSRLSELLSGLSVIRTYGLEDWSKREFSSEVNQNLDIHLKVNYLYAWSRPLTSFFCCLPLMGLVWYGGQRVMNSEISMGIFVSFVRYLESFFFLES